MKLLGESSLILLIVVLPSVALQIVIGQYFSSYINAGTSSLLRTSVQPLSSLLLASVQPHAAATLPSVQPPTFVRFLTSLGCLSHFCIFHTSVSPIFLRKLMRFLILSFISLT